MSLLTTVRIITTRTITTAQVGIRGVHTGTATPIIIHTLTGIALTITVLGIFITVGEAGRTPTTRIIPILIIRTIIIVRTTIQTITAAIVTGIQYLTVVPKTAEGLPTAAPTIATTAERQVAAPPRILPTAEERRW